MSKEKILNKYKETKGALTDLAKITAIAVPAGLAVDRGILELSGQQLEAVGFTALTIAIGFALLRR